MLNLNEMTGDEIIDNIIDLISEILQESLIMCYCDTKNNYIINDDLLNIHFSKSIYDKIDDIILKYRLSELKITPIDYKITITEKELNFIFIEITEKNPKLKLLIK